MQEGRCATNSRTHRTLGAGTDPGDALAALVAVVGRRTLRGTVEIAAGPGTGAGPEVAGRIELDDDPGFAELSARARRITADHATVRVDGVTLTVDGGTTALEADAGDDADRLLGQVGRALADGVRRPARRVSVLELATEEERALVASFEGDGAPAVPARTVHDLVGEQARRTPDAVALSFGDLSLTYRQFTGRAEALAARLVREGVRPGQVVGVLGERSPDLIVSLLAVLRAGAAYLALAPEWPEARYAELLGDASVRVVLAPRELLRRVPDGVTAVPFETPAEVPAEVSAEQVPDAAGGLPRTAPHSLAYVSYTSGSTGEPKGVCVPHAAVSRLVCSPDWASFGPQDVFLQASPVSFDASTLEIWAPLCNGGRLVLLPPGRLDLSATGRLVRAQGVTVLWLTAGLFHQMVEHQLGHLAGVRHLIAGGDVVSPQAVARLLNAHPRLRFTNGYGPTENTTFTACGTFREAVPDEPVPIGRPISGTRVRVLDADGRPVPVGVAGEIHASGAGLAHGYLGRPAATAERFVPDPGGTWPGARLYRTGDLGRWRADGGLDFLGRVDSQVKINGFRVEPDGIESVLTSHPHVEAAAVAVESGPGAGKRLAAWVVPGEGAPDGEDLVVKSLLGWLRDRLPDHLVPDRITSLSELPLTANGKVDRAALREEPRAERVVPNEYVAPGSPVERFLCDLWAEILGVDAVGVDDDFFELGGHSLIAADLLARLQQEFGVDLPARMLYLSPTVGELAELGELEKLRARLA